MDKEWEEIDAALRTSDERCGKRWVLVWAKAIGEHIAISALDDSPDASLSHKPLPFLAELLDKASRFSKSCYIQWRVYCAADEAGIAYEPDDGLCQILSKVAKAIGVAQEPGDSLMKLLLEVESTRPRAAAMIPREAPCPFAVMAEAENLYRDTRIRELVKINAEHEAAVAALEAVFQARKEALYADVPIGSSYMWQPTSHTPQADRTICHHRHPPRRDIRVEALCRHQVCGGVRGSHRRQGSHRPRSQRGQRCQGGKRPAPTFVSDAEQITRLGRWPGGSAVCTRLLARLCV